jgi:hypothetical protein
MIVTKLQGGLGNQMFQYAIGLNYALAYDVPLGIDISLLRGDQMRQYNLDLFAGLKDVHTISRPYLEANINERTLLFDHDLALRIKDGDTLRGYWQNEQYFPLARHELRKQFVPGAPVPQFFVPGMIETIKEAGTRSTFVGIRRSDYVVKQDFHGVLPMSYYEEGLSLVKRWLGEDPIVFLMSDDPEWCKTNWNLPYVTHIAGSWGWTTPTVRGREDVDMYMMSLCHNAVIANSTFHWWGAWLGPMQDRVIVAPKQWFTAPGLDLELPKGWLRI